jgi:hypothetical protein
VDIEASLQKNSSAELTPGTTLWWSFVATPPLSWLLAVATAQYAALLTFFGERVLPDGIFGVAIGLVLFPIWITPFGFAFLAGLTLVMTPLGTTIRLLDNSPPDTRSPVNLFGVAALILTALVVTALNGYLLVGRTGVLD